MSISSMTNLALNRREDVATDNAASKTSSNVEQNKAPPESAQSNTGSILAAITAYIPTEIITVYVATLGALSAPAGASPGDGLTASIAFLILTPVIVWLIYAGKVKASGKPLPTNVKEWPVWEMTAATISFAVWATALPNSPMTSRDLISSAMAAVLIMVVSLVLGLIGPLVQRPIKQSQ